MRSRKKGYETQLPHLKNPHISKKKSGVMEATSLSEARIYVGTYAKYNDGSIEGKWFDLSDFSDKDEFYEACKELHADEEDPEYMFYDKYIVMRSLDDRCTDIQIVTDLLLTSTSHKHIDYLRPLSQSRRSLLRSQTRSVFLSEVRSLYARSRASRFALESARA